MLNKKGFILYDGLVSFFLFTSMIIFFTALIILVRKQYYYNHIKLESLDALRNSSYSKYSTESNITFDEENYYSEENEESYCIKYKIKGGYDQVCQ